MKILRWIWTISIILILILLCFRLPDSSVWQSAHEALFYNKLDKKIVQCVLCPRNCTIALGKRGYCGVRENRAGSLYTLVYAKAVIMHIDPIEKKPFFHFLPSTTAFSLATVGCNLKCKFCRNWDISQARPEETLYFYLEPKQIIKKVKASGSPTIAYTYTEPTIFYEYMIEIAKLARKEGIRNVMHSSGYINEEPLRQLAKYLDAADIDLKGFTQDFYVKISDATLPPVLKALKILKEEQVFLEITNVVLPGYNDDPDTIRKMCLWIKENLGVDTPIHFLRFFPMYKLTSLNATPVETLEKARAIALACGLKFVYIGNVAGNDAENTYCPRCKKLLIERKGYFVMQNNIENGRCKFCGEKIEGVWN